MAAQPQILAGVPRIFYRFYDAIMSGISKQSTFKRKMVKNALDAKRDLYNATGQLSHWFYDKFVLNKMRENIGGKCEVLVSSAAPIDTTVMTTMRLLFSTIFLQAYGQTESTGPIGISFEDDTFVGSVGPPLSCIECKLVDVPEMNYKSTDIVEGIPTPRGELCLRGSSVFKGYFKDEAKTREAIDEQGWMHTGDVAYIHNTGVIKIIDRKINDKIESFRFKEMKITNYEMECSAIYGLSKLLGHKALTVCIIIANRINRNASADYKPFMKQLVVKILDQLTKE
jgi:long-chain acyl-CoA synthetase